MLLLLYGLIVQVEAHGLSDTVRQLVPATYDEPGHIVKRREMSVPVVHILPAGPLVKVPTYTTLMLEL